MKKTILSPLCSAFIIPGIGQVINQHVKKGVVILSAVFVLFLAFVIRLYGIINTLMKDRTINLGDPNAIMDRLKLEDPSTLFLLFLAFVILWTYSVLDAFLAGRKIDQLEKRDHI